VHNGNCQTKCARTDYVEENIVQMLIIQNSGEKYDMLACEKVAKL